MKIETNGEEVKGMPDGLEPSEVGMSGYHGNTSQIRLRWWPRELQDHLRTLFSYEPGSGQLFKLGRSKAGFNAPYLPAPTAAGHLATNIPFYGRQWFIKLVKMAVFFQTGKQYRQVYQLDGDLTNLRWANLVYSGEVVETEVEVNLWRIHKQTFQSLQTYRQNAKTVVMQARANKLAASLNQLGIYKQVLHEHANPALPVVGKTATETVAAIEATLSPMQQTEAALRKENLAIRYKFGVGDTPKFVAMQEFFAEAITSLGTPLMSPTDYLTANSTPGLTWEDYAAKEERWKWDLLKVASLLHWVRQGELTTQGAEREYELHFYRNEPAGFKWGQLVPPLEEKYQLLLAQTQK